MEKNKRWWTVRVRLVHEAEVYVLAKDRRDASEMVNDQFEMVGNISAMTTIKESEIDWKIDRLHQVVYKTMPKSISADDIREINY